MSDDPVVGCQAYDLSAHDGAQVLFEDARFHVWSCLDCGGWMMIGPGDSIRTVPFEDMRAGLDAFLEAHGQKGGK